MSLKSSGDEVKTILSYTHYNVTVSAKVSMVVESIAVIIYGQLGLA